MVRAHVSSLGVIRSSDVADTHCLLCVESRAWEVDTLRGHTNNVSCVIFHAKQVSTLSWREKDY